MTFIEAITSAIGDELTQLAGIRSTRLTTQFLPEQAVSNGVLSASSADAGVTITLASGTFGTAATGNIFRVISGALVGQSAVIVTVGGPTSITLTGPGVGFNFTSQSWEIVAAAETTMEVETALNWPATGTVYLDAIRYEYASRTDVTLDGVTRTNQQRARGRITCIAGASLVDGEIVSFDDGYGNSWVFEFDKNGAVTTDRVAVTITNGYTAAQVAAAFIDEFNNVDTIQITAVDLGAGLIDFYHKEEGVTGNVAITDTVANAGFIVVGMIGGTLVSDGAEELHEPLSEVVDFSQNNSSLDTYRRAMLVDYAEGRDLDVVGSSLGVLRPPALSDDEVYRELIKVIAYGYRGTLGLIEAILTVILGEDWEAFEDITSTWVEDPQTGLAVFPDSESLHHNIVYLRRTDTNEEEFVGKTFVDGTERSLAGSTTSITLSDTPITLISVRYADDHLEERLIAFGEEAVGTASGVTVTAPATSFNTPDIQLGDTFVLVSGALSGSRGTIASVTPTTVLTIGAIEGAPNYTIGQNFLASSWKIVRPMSSFRYNLPTDEQYIQYAGDTGTTIWTAAAVGTGVGDVRNESTANGGRFTRLRNLAASDTISYFHPMRIDCSSQSSFEICAKVFATPDVALGLQWCFWICDGTRKLAVGAVLNSGDADFVDIGFIDSAGVMIGNAVATIEHTLSFNNFRISSPGIAHPGARNVDIDFHVDGVLIDSLPYSDFDASAAREIRFGCLEPTYQAVYMYIKSADWSSSTNLDFNNVYLNDASAVSGTRDIIDDAAGGYFAVGDVGKQFRITDHGEANDSNGNPRGLWEIETRVSANRITLVGPTRRGLRSVGSAFPRRLYISNEVEVFEFPSNLGHEIVIESGANAGTYTIAKFLDPITFIDLSLAVPLTLPNIGTGVLGLMPFHYYTNVIEVSIDLPDPADDEEVNWHLKPVLTSSDPEIIGTLVDVATVAGPVVTLRKAMPITPVVESEFTSVLSGQIHETRDDNVLDSPSVYHLYPFYLYERWGYIRDLIDIVTVAGVKPDFDSLVRDESGLHILE